jgi:hypothetical protein
VKAVRIPAGWVVAIVAAFSPICARAQTKAYTPVRLADGAPDLNGIWQAPKGIDNNLEAKFDGKNIIVDPADGRIPYLPAAEARRLENKKTRATADPVSKCFMPGTPRLMYFSYPFQIAQASDQLAILSEFVRTVRHIYLRRERHLPEIEFWMGDSIARWDGDTLAVDTSDLNDQPWLDASGNYHSDALHVVERFTRTAPDLISYEATMEDPKVFARPWKIRLPLLRHKEKNFQILEHECYAMREGPTITVGDKPDPHREGGDTSRKGQPQ